MLDYVKKKIQDIKIEQCAKKHEELLPFFQDRYARWIEVHESAYAAGAVTAEFGETEKMKVVSYDEIGSGYPLQRWKSEIVVFADVRAGSLDERALSLMECYFDEHKEADLIYADEDYQCGSRRIAPWMKPCFSPDTLMSFQYFGHFFALRRQKYENVEWTQQADSDVRIYDFLLKCAQDGGSIVHLPEVLYHNRITAEELAAYERLEKDAYDRDHPRKITADENMPWHQRLSVNQERFDKIRLDAAKRWGYPARIEPDAAGVRQLLYEIKPERSGKLPLVSIVIPSKDNVDVLERCLSSIRAHSAYTEYEILVVDNGSSGAARTRLMNLAERLTFHYFYQPMEFNFSAMVNYGVSQAAGSYILLLNDDCEVLQDDWLIRMLGQAQLPHVGAVGAKLLYPQSDLIQHTGVTNLAVGPAHKLQEKTDSFSYYYGRNRMNYNYIGVTAACLLVSKEIYNRAGGFDENIRVAFNDVDFCFTLVQQGLYHVIRSDVILYHYESLSRGNDLLSEEKRKRMMSERDRLYEKHPDFLGRDPFYSPNLLGNAVDYIVNYHFDYEKEDYVTDVRQIQPEIQPEWYNDSVFVTVEHCCKVEALELRDQESTYNISGWAYVLNQDNCRYEMSLLLYEEGSGIWLEAEVSRYWRPDVEQILPDQRHVELSGFLARIRQSELSKGSYQVYVFMKDLCSRQKLLKNTGEVLTAE